MPIHFLFTRTFTAAVILCLTGTLYTGCKQTSSPHLAPEKVETPKVSDIFQSQMLKFLSDAGKLVALTQGNPTLTEIRNQLAEARASFDLLEATWPVGFAHEAQKQFQLSMNGYNLAVHLWDSKIRNVDEPVEPDTNNWKSYVAYAGDRLKVDVYPSDFIVPEYAGKKYLPFAENVVILLALANSQFNTGREDILQNLH